MAQYVLEDLVKKSNLTGEYFIDSAGTSSEESGNGVHSGTRKKLKAMGIACGDHRARRITKQDYKDFDIILGMDNYNMKNMLRFWGGDPQKKIHGLLDFTSKSGSIADPWYTGNFDDTYRDVNNGCVSLLKHLESQNEI